MYYKNVCLHSGSVLERYGWTDEVRDQNVTYMRMCVCVRYFVRVFCLAKEIQTKISGNPEEQKGK